MTTIVQLASDLHLEFGIEHNLRPCANTLILAGDIMPFVNEELVDNTFKSLSSLFKKIVYVPGNHEYYAAGKKKHMENLLASAKTIAGKYGNIIILNNETYDLTDKIRLIGSTLWSRIPKEAEGAISNQMNDYRYIYAIIPADTSRLHEDARSFIDASILKAEEEKKIPVVITHHAPLMKETSSPEYEYEGRILSHAFSSDLSELLKTRFVPYWFFGHTHWSCDFMFEKTRIVSNPRGYVGERVMFRPAYKIGIDHSSAVVSSTFQKDL